MQTASPIASPPKPHAKILRFLWLSTLASELAFLLGITASVLLLSHPENSNFLSAFIEKLPHGAAFELAIRFLLLALGAQLLSILARLNFGDRGRVIPSSIRWVFYLVFIALVMPAFGCA